MTERASLGEFLRECLVGREHRPWSRYDLSGAKWRAFIGRLAGESWELLGLWSDPPSLHALIRDVPAGVGPFTVELSLKSNSHGSGQLFWSTAVEQGFKRERSVSFEPQHDGKWHDYTIKLPIEKPITGIRLDPATAAGEIELRKFRLQDSKATLLKSWIGSDK